MKMFGSGFAVVAGAALAMAVGLGVVAADTPALPSINLPAPYANGVSFGQLPEGREWGLVIAVTPGANGKSIWAFERCGGNCLNSDLPPVLQL
jgi:hypothetical protein